MSEVPPSEETVLLGSSQSITCGCYEMKPNSCSKKRVLYIVCGMAIATVVVLLAFLGAVYAIVGVNGFPLHASCKITWSFGSSCQNASDTIVHQILSWQGEKGCENGGQRCLYSLMNRTGLDIKAKHKTPVKKYVDDLSFQFQANDNDTCISKGYSRSETWYAVLDFGTNYCNLHNLITGSGLDKTAKYKEDTSNSQCTQYTVADCDKY